MRCSLLLPSAACALALITACSTPAPPLVQPTEAPSPANPAFAGEMAKFNAQFPNAKASRYETESLRFNNEQKLHEKGDCHGKSIYPITIILVLDANGKVVSSTTDVDNEKAACFANSYAGVKFPKPPFGQYRKPILLK
ncbi:MAG: hypothetical protein ACJ8GW_12680 [Massilia sp.]